MSITYLHLSETPSTNALMTEMLRVKTLPSGFVVAADFQSAGRGQANSKWETERGKNLTFSILYFPENLLAIENFIISQAAALAVKTVLDNEIAAFTDDRFSVKWSNDVYFQDKKICGILIENTLKVNVIQHSIIGIGININQTAFHSGEPNPISLSQITHQNHNLKDILHKICEEIFFILENKKEYCEVKTNYFNSLYRLDGFYLFQTPDGETFSAKIFAIENDGKLILATENGEKRGFYFKEVRFL
ncbi:MAG: biotin--[acetyl-CoA-carboxylase] ligase [Prevotellaceae bacterium]|jgi:BirA family biotin operon repressor/biotin-[acetyl-CoA-carboxylase] ligase|nr:biotin--[acetyl-CoA-carboxylase] ligase [Prevotellaceae bacterium]